MPKATIFSLIHFVAPACPLSPFVRYQHFLCLLTKDGAELAATHFKGSELPAAHFEPQVAMLCDTKSDQPYRSQYMTEAGHWATDLVHKVTCYKDKLDILEYCKKVIRMEEVQVRQHQTFPALPLCVGHSPVFCMLLHVLASHFTVTEVVGIEFAETCSHSTPDLSIAGCYLLIHLEILSLQMWVDTGQ
ncbi:Amyloid-like protein 2 [Homalodisca vitripennis]|nr:Amyloid-like protein 2 [Homalodisca vitripennis]